LTADQRASTSLLYELENFADHELLPLDIRFVEPKDVAALFSFDLSVKVDQFTSIESGDRKLRIFKKGIFKITFAHIFSGQPFV
jgi:hypothetical protein